MSDLLKYVRVQKEDGTYTDNVPIGADAENIAMSNGMDLQSNFNDIELALDTKANMSMVGSPLIAPTAAAMIDTNKIYVYTGSETGYTNGNWYYYNGSNWVSGGVYNSVAIQTDKTLSVPDVPADAAAAGGIVKISSTQPSEVNTRIWVAAAEDEYELPTMEEFNQLSEKINKVTEPYINFIYAYDWVTDGATIEFSGDDVILTATDSTKPAMAYIDIPCKHIIISFESKSSTSPNDTGASIRRGYIRSSDGAVIYNNNYITTSPFTFLITEDIARIALYVDQVAVPVGTTATFTKLQAEKPSGAGTPAPTEFTKNGLTAVDREARKDVAGLKSEDVHIKTDIFNIEQDITNLENNIENITEDISNLQGVLKNISARTNQLFNKNDADVFSGFDMTGTVQASTNAKSVIVPVDITNQTQLTVHRTVLSARFAVATFTTYPAVGSTSINHIVNNSNYLITIPVSSNIKYVMILIYNASMDTTYTFEQIIEKLMVQYGDSFTGYESYYITKIMDGQVTQEKLTNTLQVQVEQGETDKILFSNSTNLWNTPLLEVMNNTRISGYNTTTYEINTVVAEGYMTAIMNIPENINFLRIKKSSTLPSAGQAYVLIDSTKRISNNRPFSAFSDSFKDINVRYDSGNEYYTVDLAHARNYGFTKLGICAYNTANMYVLTDKITSKWLVCNPDIYCPVGAFGSIGAIGDSYTAGSIVKSDSSWVDMPNQSYIAVMGKRAGVNWSNYGMGGTNTRTYIANKLADVLSANANDFYFLALGINDSSLGSTYIGTIADINDSDYTQNADTFYGNYGKIIAQVKAHAPNARFCMVKIPIYVTLRQELNAAIQEIADHYGFACIDPMDDPYFYSKTFYSRISNHPSCIGYAGMALAYERLLSKAIEKNPLYFFYSNIDANIPTAVS